MMSIEQENAKNEQYIFQYKGDYFSEVITYRKHLINKIKTNSNAIENTAIQTFSSESVRIQDLNRLYESQVMPDILFTKLKNFKLFYS